nr:MAG TPA: hypothetical protein [Caudoviricetes sp.]
MKSKRAEQVLDVASFTDEFDYRYVHFENACEAVELAEQDAEEEVNHYRKELEESKRREELARKVIDDQRKKIEMLKARAVCAFDSLDFTELMTAECVQDFDNVKCRLRGLFLQILNEQ